MDLLACDLPSQGLNRRTPPFFMIKEIKLAWRRKGQMLKSLTRPMFQKTLFRALPLLPLTCMQLLEVQDQGQVLYLNYLELGMQILTSKVSYILKKMTPLFKVSFITSTFDYMTLFIIYVYTYTTYLAIYLVISMSYLWYVC